MSSCIGRGRENRRGIGGIVPSLHCLFEVEMKETRLEWDGEKKRCWNRWDVVVGSVIQAGSYFIRSSG